MNDEEKVTRLTLIRHGETAWNQNGRIQGHMDIALNPHGLAQAQRMGQALAGSDIAVIYSSDLARAWQTAQALQEQIAKPLHADAGLRERHFGALQGLTLKEIMAQDEVLAAAFQNRDPHYQPPGGETMLAFQQRVLQTVNALAAAHVGEHIALVSHGGALDCIYRSAVGLDLRTPRAWPIDNTSIHRLLWTPQGLRLLAWGDVEHLQTLERPPGEGESQDPCRAPGHAAGGHYV